MVSEAQKRARRNFVNRFAYGLGRGVAHAKREHRTPFRVGRKKVKTEELKTLRSSIAFFVGLGKGISKRKKQQLAEEKKLLAKSGRGA